MTKRKKHKWTFRARFRRHAFGWRSQPAIKRIKEAVSEIKKAARKDPVPGAEGAVLFLEKVSPAIEQVDGSSGSIGTAVNHAIDVPLYRSPHSHLFRAMGFDSTQAAERHGSSCRNPFRP